MLNFKKSQPIIKLFFTFILAGAFLAPLPVFAEDEPENPTIEEPTDEEIDRNDISPLLFQKKYMQRVSVILSDTSHTISLN